MKSIVNLQTTGLSKRSIAVVALVWLLAAVSSLVIGQMTGLNKCSVAMVALVRAFARVRSLVYTQFTGGTKRSIAVFALVWTFARVDSLKRMYEHLAENEEKAASAANKMATHYTKLASLIEHSPDFTKTRSLLGDSAYRR